MDSVDFTTRSLIEYLQMRESATVPGIAAHLRLPAPTATGIIYRLMKSGAIYRSQPISGRRGRPRITYRLRLPSVIGVYHWDGTQLSGALFDEDTTALAVETCDASSIASVEDAVALAESLLAEMLKKCGLPRSRLEGIALSVNAVNVGGRSVTSSVVPWANEHLGESLANAIGLPVRVMAQAVILAEYRTFPEPAPRSMSVLRAGDGVSAHAIESGQRLIGRHSLAGELGHVTYDEQGSRCGCGRRGCLETICSGPAIRRRILEDLSQGTMSEMRIDELSGLSARGTIVRLWEAWQRGDTYARSVMDPTLDALAWGLGLVLNLLDPDVVIAGGYVLQDHPAWIEEIERRSQRWALHAAKRSSVLKPAQATLEDEMRVSALGFHPHSVADEMVLPSKALPSKPRRQTNPVSNVS